MLKKRFLTLFAALLLAVALPLLYGTQPAQAQTAPVISKVDPNVDETQFVYGIRRNAGETFAMMVGNWKPGIQRVTINGVAARIYYYDPVGQPHLLRFYIPNFPYNTILTIALRDGSGLTSLPYRLRVVTPILEVKNLVSLRNADQSITVKFTLYNRITSATPVSLSLGCNAPNLKLKVALLRGIASSTTLPVSVPTGSDYSVGPILNAFQTSGQMSLTFPATVGAKGTVFTMALKGECGTFNQLTDWASQISVTLP